jgi:cyclophilin family peptidyl-prolyl cis-trans isomerase
MQAACSGEEKKAVKKYDDPYLDSLAQITHEIRDEGNHFVTLETNFGTMTAELYRDVAPAHADSFLARVNDGFYRNQVFHRIIDNFMIQGGDPTGTGTGGPGYNLPAEFSKLEHKDGTLSMARGRSENSAGSQFFICLGRNRSTQSLDGKYTVFGQLIRGYDVLHSIAKVKVGPSRTGEMSAPLEPVKLITSWQSDAEGKPIKKGEEEQ